MNRRTIARPVSLEGIGLHLGAACRVSFQPAPSGAGISFCRTDLANSPIIPALANRAVLTERRTQLGDDPVSVHTVEHVLAAVGGCEIDDVRINLDAAEPPIMDGSAAPFVEALLSAGIVEQSGAPDVLTLRRPVRITDGESIYEARPARDLELTVTIDFPHPSIGVQRGCYRVTRDTFVRDLAPARTFGFMHEVEALRAQGVDPGRVARQHGRSRREWSARDDAALARRVRAAQGVGLRR